MLQAVIALVEDFGEAPVSSPTERRTSERAAADFGASVRARGSAARMEAEVLDISTDGCKLRATGYAVGDEVLIALAHLAPIPARICWGGDGLVGVRFDAKLHPSIASHLASL
jgi:hypothetical protein